MRCTLRSLANGLLNLTGFAGLGLMSNSDTTMATPFFFLLPYSITSLGQNQYRAPDSVIGSNIVASCIAANL